MARKGVCVICGRAGRLTDDHVPPRSVAPPTELEVKGLIAALGGSSERGRPAHQSQVFRTLCSDCNNERLGKFYDPELKRFCDQFSTWVRGSVDLGLILPDARISCRPGAVARSVIGHLLAAVEAKTSAPRPTGDAIRAMQEYFLDPMASADGLELYAWPFPSPQHAVLRGVYLANVIAGTPGYGTRIVGDVFKFFPVGWWLVYDRVGNGHEGWSRFPLTPVRAEMEEVELRLRDTPKTTWPEVVGPNESLLFSDQHATIAGRPRPR